MDKKIENEAVTPEVIEPDKGTGQDLAMVQAGEDPKDVVDTTLYLAENIEKLAEARKRIHQALYKIAEDGDWVVFKSGNDERCCLTSAGAERIGSVVGVKFSNMTCHKDLGQDEKGSKYWWYYEAIASIGNRSILAVGRAGSRDKFFGKAHGEWKQIDSVELDESNIKIAAYHSCLKEGVRILLGLRSIPKNALEKVGVKLQYARKYEFKKNTPPTTDANGHREPTIREKVGNLLGQLCGVDNIKAQQDMLETMTTFTNKERKIIKGKRSLHDVSDKQAGMVLKKLREKASDMPPPEPDDNEPAQ